MVTQIINRGFINSIFTQTVAFAIMAVIAAAGLLNNTAQAELNAKTDYGAVGNNVTDDTVAIKNWIAAVISTGQTGFLPVGTYKCTNQIVFLLNGAAAPLGCTFRGDGVGRSIINVLCRRKHL